MSLVLHSYLLTSAQLPESQHRLCLSGTPYSSMNELGGQTSGFRAAWQEMTTHGGSVSEAGVLDLGF